MGYSISQRLHETIERLRRDGRLCAGPSRARWGCTRRSIIKVLVETTLGGGRTQQNEMTMCDLHAGQQPPGFVGANFRVLRHEEF